MSTCTEYLKMQTLMLPYIYISVAKPRLRPFYHNALAGSFFETKDAKSTCEMFFNVIDYIHGTLCKHFYIILRHRVILH